MRTTLLLICFFATSNLLSGQLPGNCVSGNCITGSGVFVFTKPKDARYTGDFDKGMLSGKGKLEFPDGRKYEGGFLNNKFHGEGTYYLNKEEKFTGTFDNSSPVNGVGTFFNPSDSTKTTGTMTNGDFSGKCQIIYNNGSKYDGYIKNNDYEGFGIRLYKNGDTYQGNWVNGQREGQGIWKDKTGKLLYAGLWKKGQPVNIASVNASTESELKEMREGLLNRSFKGMKTMVILKDNYYSETIYGCNVTTEIISINDRSEVSAKITLVFTLKNKKYTNTTSYIGLYNSTSHIMELKNEKNIYTDDLPKGYYFFADPVSLSVYKSKTKPGHFILDAKDKNDSSFVLED